VSGTISGARRDTSLYVTFAGQRQAARCIDLDSFTFVRLEGRPPIMLRRLAFCIAVVVAALGLTACRPMRPPDFTVLVFSKTGFRHDSIPPHPDDPRPWARRTTSAVEATEDATQFTATNLARFKAVVWLSTTGDVLDATQQTAFENYIRAGGGYVGVQRGGDTEYGWAWYGGLVGAYFASTRRSRPRRSASPTRTTPATGRPAGRVEPHRRVVQLPDQPRRRCTSWRSSTRLPTPRLDG